MRDGSPFLPQGALAAQRPSRAWPAQRLAEPEKSLQAWRGETGFIRRDMQDLGPKGRGRLKSD